MTTSPDNLKTMGLKATLPRLRILELFETSKVRHLSAEDIYKLLLEVPEAEIGPVKELVRTEMCAAYPLDPPLAVDVGVGDDWNEAKG